MRYEGGCITQTHISNFLSNNTILYTLHGGEIFVNITLNCFSHKSLAEEKKHFLVSHDLTSSYIYKHSLKLNSQSTYTYFDFSHSHCFPLVNAIFGMTYAKTNLYIKF